MQKAGISVLLVEGNSQHAKLVQRAFEPCGDEFRVTVAGNLAKLRNRLAEPTPDLLIVNLVLPDARGTELLPHERDSATVPLLLIASQADEQVAADTIKKGTLDYVDKSEVTLADLPNIARRVVRQWQYVVENKEAERALRESEARFADLYNNAPDMMCSIDAATGTVVRCNQTMADSLGYTKEEIVGRPVFDLYHEDCREHVRNHVYPRFVRSGRIDNEALQAQRKDGSKIDVILSNTATRDEQGNVLQSHCVWRDVTERNQIEVALRTSEHRYRQLAESIDQVFWLYDISNKSVLYASPAYETIWGQPCQSLYDNPDAWIQVIHPDDRDRVAAAFVEQRERATFEEEYRILRPDGSIRWIHDRGFPVRDEHGKAYRIAGTATDITDRKQVEHVLRVREGELAHISRVNTMGEMAIVLAHEINQPLAAIANYAATCTDLLANDQFSHDDLRGATSQIDKQTQRAGEIVNRLKRFVAKTSPKRDWLELNQLVRDVCGLMESQIQSHQCVLQLKLCEPIPGLRGDAPQVQQVLVNLIQNALEAMTTVERGKSRILISTEELDDAVQLSVSDRGTGISPEASGKLFDPYFSTKPDGLGMGLMISRRIIQAHGGRLSARANPDCGATFQFTLPLEAGMSPRRLSRSEVHERLERIAEEP